MSNYLYRRLLESRNFLLGVEIRRIQRTLNWGMVHYGSNPKDAKYKALAEIKKVRESLDHYENMIISRYGKD